MVFVKKVRKLMITVFGYSAIYQIEGNFVSYNPVLMHEALKLISKES